MALAVVLIAAAGLFADSASARVSSHHHRRHSRHQRRLAPHIATDRAAPTLWVSTGSLHWTATATSHEYVEARTDGATTTYTVVVGTADTPPERAGTTVTYQVRPRYRPRAWSNEVKVAYPGGGHRTHEGGPEQREREEREAKERAEREARERTERERREREERERKGGEEPSGAVIGAAPVGPPSPASGWHIAYGDAFGDPLGSGAGHDNTLESGEKWDGCCTNSDEVAVEQHSQARVGPEGLELICSVGSFTIEGHTRGASCGAVRGRSAFQFAASSAGEWAVEIDARWPACEGGADPGWWTYPSASGEIDFFEGWCWSAGWRPATSWAGAEAGIPVLVGQGRHEIFPVSLGLGFDPSLAFHRYTTVFVPEGSGRYDVREYVDGVFRWDTAGNTLSSTYAGLDLTNGLREHVQADVMTVRSVGFWQDGAHAGAGTIGGGIAPGTTLG